MIGIESRVRLYPMLPIPVFVLSLCLGINAQTRVTPYRNNLARSGENLTETMLTPANVNQAQLGKIFSRPVAGQLYPHPLDLPAPPIPRTAVHHVIFPP